MKAGTLRAAAITVLVSAGPALADPAAGEQAFKTQCGECHARAGTLARNLKGATAEERTTAIDEFLKTHHAEEVEVREAIVDYLVALAGI